MKYALNFLPVIFLIYACEFSTDHLDTEDIISVGVKEMIYSKVLEEDREIWIYVPPDYYTMNQVNMVYPVVYLMDPTEQFVSTVGILQQLSVSNANNFCPQMIVVGVRHWDRNIDLTPRSEEIEYDTKGGADMLGQFMEDELIPYIDKNYSTASHRVLIGHSLGGLLVFNTMMHRPHLFSNYISIDPAMYWEDGAFATEVLDSLASKDFQQKKLYIGTANNYTSWITESTIDADTSVVAVMTKYSLDFGEAVEKLELQNLTVRQHYYENEIHGTVPGPATRDALRWFYQDYSYDKMMEYYNPDFPDNGVEAVSDIKQHYDKLSVQLDYTVVPLESYINAYAFGLLQFGKPNIAHALLKMNKENYPESASVHSGLGYYKLGQQDTVAALEHFNTSVDIFPLDFVVETLKSL